MVSMDDNDTSYHVFYFVLSCLVWSICSCCHIMYEISSVFIHPSNIGQHLVILVIERSSFCIGSGSTCIIASKQRAASCLYARRSWVYPRLSTGRSCFTPEFVFLRLIKFETDVVTRAEREKEEWHHHSRAHLPGTLAVDLPPDMISR